MVNWRSLKGVVANGDYYEVSDTGLVRNTISNKYLKPRTKREYPQVVLCFEGGRRDYNIHRLVALTFLPTKAHGLQVNHIDGNKANNKITNLEWVTPRENTAHAFASGLRSEARHAENMKKAHAKPVTQYDLLGNVLNVYESAADASRITGVRADTISLQCRFNRMPRSNDFYFRFTQ
jgi:hypothetical protein